MKKEDAKKLVVKGLRSVTHLPAMQAEWRIWAIQDFIGEIWGKDKEKEFAEICMWRDLGRMNDFLKYL